MSKYDDYRVLSGAKANRVNIAKDLSSLKPSTYELSPGEVYHQGKTAYEIIEAPFKGSCRGCDLLVGGICQKSHKCPCTAYSRVDQTWMIFKKITK